MVESGWGRIVNIAGLAARKTGNVVGTIRNVAVAAMTKNLADELGPRGVNVNVVHPGMTRTERTARGDGRDGAVARDDRRGARARARGRRSRSAAW